MARQLRARDRIPFRPTRGRNCVRLAASRRDSQGRPFRHIRRDGLPMSALGEHPFVKMNGLGNEIVVIDMRSAPRAIPPAEARAAATARGGAPYDQMMVLYPPRTPGTDAF